MIIEYGLFIMVVGDKVFLDLDYVGFIKMSFMPVTKYFGDFNFVYIYLLIICLLFKASYDLKKIKEIIDVDNKTINIISCILFFGLSLFVHFNIFIGKLFWWVVIIEYLMVFLLIWIGWKKINVSSIKE